METQYGKFLDMIRAIRINVPLVDVLAGMSNYAKRLKELVRNKHKLEQISSAFLSDESYAMIQNKVPPKLGDPKSFLIPCTFSKAFSCNALADLAENMLVGVGKFPFPVDFVILEMEEDSKVLLILGIPFLHMNDVVIQVKQKQLNLGVGTEQMSFSIDFAMKHSYSNNDTCFSIDVINEILEEYFDALLDEGSKILHSIEGSILKEKLFVEFNEFMAMNIKGNSESKSDTEEPPFEKITFNIDYKIKTSLEEPPLDLELKPLPNHLEYVFSEQEPSFILVIISSQLSEQNKNKLFSVLKRHKQAFAWNTTYIVQKVKVFMDDFSVFGNSFDNYLNNLDKMLQHFKDTNLVLNWEKCYFMVEEGIVLGHKVSGAGLKVDKANIDIIFKLLPPTNVKDIRSFLGHAGTENVAADHLSQIDNDETSDDSDVNDDFPGETLMEITTKDTPWFADFVNYVVDYVSKWAKAQALPTNDARVVISFLKKLFCRFSMPKALISDRGTHFCNKIIEKTMKRYGVTHRFSTSYHPQTSRQVENTNRALKTILETTVKDNPAIWSRNLDDALWAFRTAYKTPTETIPYKLLYGKNCHLPFKIEHGAYYALRNCNPGLIATSEKRMF
ncbi:reverse transcriptase domain-containing protein [Tanacetum coccineum]